MEVGECCKFWIVLLSIVSSLLVAVVSGSNNLPDDPRVLEDLFPLTLVHINDFHARFEETNLKSINCTDVDRGNHRCVAGLARVYTIIKRLLHRHNDKNAIYLNAGDNFQGSLWYNLLRWEVMAEFMKKLKPTAMTLGNHEFDHGSKGLAPYLKELNGVGIPTLVANLQLNGEERLENSNIRKSLVLEIGSKKVGIIGVLYDKTHIIVHTGKVTFRDAADAVREEALHLHRMGIDKIVVLSHCGLEDDKRIAADAGEHIDVIVGAHSHSFLRSPDSNAPYDNATDVIVGDYPLVVNSKDNGKAIPIVQAMAFGKYVGRLTVYFDNDGNLKYWEGFPVYINGSVHQDEQIVHDMQPWREKLWKLGSTVVSETRVRLNREPCRKVECTLGSVAADAYASAWTNETFRPSAFIQAGNFRNPIPIGPITNGLIIEAIPYSSTVDLLKLSGQNIWDMFEHSYTWDDENRTNCLQVSGFKVRIDPSKPFYNRVVTIEVRNHSNIEEKMYSPLNLNDEYFVVAPSYLADAKDGFVWAGNASSRKGGPLDADVLTDYVAKLKVIEGVKMGRVQICGVNWDCVHDGEVLLRDDGISTGKL
ncbi:apyrase-like [Ochlerotatus camptorhynchus]|uniref:apyrase-like n=1 Tax=Ochlerotatus camptorhynchus TaxID=644619 RepID=UPI0031E102F0